MNAAQARGALTSNSTISIGLAITIAGVIFLSGVGWNKIDATADDLDTLETLHGQRLKILEDNQTRGIVIQGQLTDLLNQQQADQDRIDQELDETSREIWEIRRLIDQLQRPGGSVGGAPPP